MTQQLPKHCAASDTSKEEQLPNQLTSAEYQELQCGSGIHPDIIKLNFFHLEGNTALDRLFISDKLKRINTGAVSYSILKRYRHIEAGGWWVSGIDVLNNYHDDLWGQFKPLLPRLSADKGKIIKYEGPPKYPTGIIALKVSRLLWHTVARLNNIKLFLSPLTLRLSSRTVPISFWSWVVSNRSVPLIITEGAKKAAALLSLGYAAIALPGVFNGYRQPKDEFGRKTGLAKLIPQLQVFAQPGRKVCFAFDKDTKASTIANVNIAIAKTGKLFAKAGVDVKVIRWQESAKGVDDLIVQNGAEAFHQAYDQALSLETWLVRSSVGLTYKANIQVNRRYLGSLVPCLAKTGLASDRLPRSLVEAQRDSPEGADRRRAIRLRSSSSTTGESSIRALGREASVPHVGRRQKAQRACPHAGSRQEGEDKNDKLANQNLQPDTLPPTPYPLSIPETAKLICLKSPKGTGKTYLLEQIVDKATREGKWVLLLTHRIQLGEALCQRVGLPYLSEIKTVEYGTILGYGLCIDSLHPNSGARFNADNWEDGIVIIDEAEQVIWHMLNSATCANERVEILAQFKTLIQNNLSGDGQVYLADADLSDVAIDYIRSLAGFHVEPFVVVNDWQPPIEQRWTIHNYEEKNPARLVRDLVNHIEAGGRPFISCSAQKLKSKWGTQNLESYLQLKFPNKKILRIDSETVADPSHPAYGCIAHLNEILPNYDLAIASPSIETGVSIECERRNKRHWEVPIAFQLLLQGINTSLGKIKKVPHFDSVWAIAQGVQTADSIRQALARIRANVPRYLWAAKRGFHKCMVGNGATVKKALIASTKNKASKNIRYLQLADTFLSDLDLDTNFQPESLNTWARRGCYINLTMQNYRSSIVEGLIAEGHEVTAPNEPKTEVPNRVTDIETQLKQVAQTKYQTECTQVADAPIPTDTQYKKLKDKRAKTKSERWVERKGNLVRRYGSDVSITPDLVAKDDEGWYGKILSHYYLTVGRQYLIERDLKQLKAIAKHNQNRLWLPDFNRSLLSTPLRLLETLIINLLKPGVQYRGSDPNIKLIAELAHANKRELKTFLGLTIVDSDTPIKIAQKLLSLLGLKLTYIGRLGSREQRERVYVFESPNDGREEIFTNWLQKDNAFTQAELASSGDVYNLSAVSTIGKDNNLSPEADIEIESGKNQIIQPGTIVEWLKAKGTWIVEATTGIVAKIKDKYGKEALVNCQELKCCQS
ncbi:plasmid replication protein, CyRepA1 family [Pleurocapsa sp. PCC 7319]|uniref:plasmid replication protein, CyRepA1 family n=1 Tax=Pleurocapsa sp. PCC 7319 TaxID=118161 RepID=UPI00036426F0|nr:plasmid replication protein, CyRepA1 family [Pleurocapsa sp. PCC 7319]